MVNLENFARLIQRESMKSTPIMTLLNKFDLFEKLITSKPPRDYFPAYTGGLNPWLACVYFASEFLKLDERPGALLRIYRTSAVERVLFKATIDDIAPWLT